MEAPIQCKENEKMGYWWGGIYIDPSEPGFESGKGVFIIEPRRCKAVANRDSEMCPWHEFLAALPRCNNCERHKGHEEPCITDGVVQP